MYARKRRVGPLSALFLALLYGTLLTIVATADLFLSPKLSPGEPLTFAVRVPELAIYSDTMTGGASLRVNGLRRGRGEVLTPQEQRLVQTYEVSRRPPSVPVLVGLGLGFALIFLLLGAALKRQAATGHVRTHFVLFGAMLLLALLSKALFVLTAWSPLWAPLALLAIPVAFLVGPAAGAAIAAASACMISLLTPVDLPLLAVLLGQGLAASGGTRNAKDGRRLALAGIHGAFGGAVAYFATTLLLHRGLPPQLTDFSFSAAEVLGSDLAATIAAPLLFGLLSLAVVPALEHVLGQISKSRLVALADLEHPLLKRLATVAPGTWAHSLSMANMAEMAANAIGANAMLVRVGAYFHDIGKTVQPEYFIENQDGKNPHDELEPQVSADAICSHVPEGTKLARRAGLPEPVVDFIYTHHGDSLLEYFWHKVMRQHKGQPTDVDERDFRYHGIPPQTRETALLALCDSVEAASKSIKDPDLDQIKQLVRQILFTKLEQGMLDESGLTVQDLHKTSESLIETLRSAMHVRVRYPWQDATSPGSSGPKAKLAAAPQPAAQRPPAAAPPAAALSARPRASTAPLGGREPD